MTLSHLAFLSPVSYSLGRNKPNPSFTICCLCLVHLNMNEQMVCVLLQFYFSIQQLPPPFFLPECRVRPTFTMLFCFYPLRLYSKFLPQLESTFFFVHQQYTFLLHFFSSSIIRFFSQHMFVFYIPHRTAFRVFYCPILRTHQCHRFPPCLVVASSANWGREQRWQRHGETLLLRLPRLSICYVLYLRIDYRE